MILGIDTATEWVYVALADGGAAWARRAPTGPGSSASAVLLPLVDEMLSEARAGRCDISGAAVCIGPGGFTGLRVGVATAEGLAALGVPAWGFSAFELRARSLARGGRRGAAYLVLDGQRREAFLQPWDLEAPRAIGPAAKVPIAELPSAIGGEAWWAPERFRPVVAPLVARPPVVPPDEGGSALDALAGLCRICKGRPPEDPLVPFYLRETDAEVNFPAASAHLKDAHRRGLAR
jgi:tRNA threonylcarbamoyladenosine biosynthesis protein TsaB